MLRTNFLRAATLLIAIVAPLAAIILLTALGTPANAETATPTNGPIAYDRALAAVTPEDAAGWFAHAGYEPQDQSL